MGKMGWSGVVRSHLRALVISPFDKAHIGLSSYSTFAVTLSIFCTVSGI